MKFTLEFLGTGTSVGVPAIACDCGVCTSSDPRNQRLRSSALVRGYNAAGEVETTVVIDTTPDFRQQMLRSRVKRIDGLIVTHFHADHVMGIDDVRRFNSVQKMVLDCWGSAATIENLRQSFGYVLSETLNLGWPCLRPRELRYGEAFEIGCLRFEPVELDHVVVKTAGLKISCGDSATLAYCLDVKRISDASFTALHGVDTLVLDMLREQPHPTHMNLEEAQAALARIQPRRAYFGHIAHEIDHGPFEARLPESVRIAYDGLVLEMA